jgi:hypothetical protein
MLRAAAARGERRVQVTSERRPREGGDLIAGTTIQRFRVL